MARRSTEEDVSQRVATWRRMLPDLGLVSSALVMISSIFDQLEEEYLSSDEKAKFGLVLRRKYRELVYIAARSRDDEARARLRRLLVALGSISVRLVEREEAGGCTCSVRLRAAIRGGAMVQWVNHFYSAVHEIREPQSTGELERVELDRPSYDEFCHELALLLRWVQDRVER